MIRNVGGKIATSRVLLFTAVPLLAVIVCLYFGGGGRHFVSLEVIKVCEHAKAMSQSVVQKINLWETG